MFNDERVDVEKLEKERLKSIERKIDSNEDLSEREILHVFGIAKKYQELYKNYENSTMEAIKKIGEKDEQVKDAERIIRGVLEGKLPDWYKDKYENK